MPAIGYPGVYVEETSAGTRAIEGVPTSIAAFIGFTAKGVLNRAVTIASVGDFVARFGAATPEAVLPLAVADFFANGGRTAIVVRCAGRRAGKAAPPTAGQLIGSQRSRTGLHALDAVDRFNLLCIPDAARPLPGTALPDRRVDAARVVAAAAQYCAVRRALLLIDPPAGSTTLAAALSWRATLPGLPTARNAAAYWPRLRDAGEGAGAPGRAPSGAIAGVIARVDAARGVWKPPAGAEATIAGAAAPTASLDTAGQDRLARAGINLIRHLGGRGIAAWGARCLAAGESGDPQDRYVPVRRLILHVENSVATGLAWTVAEPNTPPLWARIRGLVEAFLTDLFRAGAFAATRPRDAFYVRCDATTMTQADIDAGRLILEIGVAPLKPAEFVIIRLGLWTAADA